MFVPCVLCVPIRILTVPFPQKTVEADQKKKDVAAAKELKAAQKAANKADDSPIDRKLKVRRYVSNQYILLCVLPSPKTIFG